MLRVDNWWRREDGEDRGARNMEEWWLLVSGLGIGNGSTSSVAVVEGDNGFRRLVANRSYDG